MKMTIKYSGIMVTGEDEKGNEFTYWKSSEPTEKGEEYFDGYNEQYTSLRCFNSLVVPIVKYARFGEYEITGDAWRFIGSPDELTLQQIIDLQTIENLTINDLELLDTARHLCNTDPAHILNVEQEWLKSGGAYMEGDDMAELQASRNSTNPAEVLASYGIEFNPTLSPERVKFENEYKAKQAEAAKRARKAFGRDLWERKG